MTTYQCKACGKAADVKNGAVVRTCACPKDTTVVANLKATATGESKVAG